MSDDEDLSGDMGVSSEREGPTGPGQIGTHGTIDTSPDRSSDPAPEQRSAAQAAADEVGAEEEEGRPAGEGDETDVRPNAPIPPVSGYNSHDPRSADHPYQPRGPAAEAGA